MTQIIFSLLLLFPPAQLELNHVRIAGDYPCVCSVGPGDGLRLLEPCAWRAAQLGLTQKFPQLKKRIYKVKPPVVRYVQSAHHGEYGWTDKHGVVVVEKASTEENWDTLIHEFAHWINRHMNTTGMEQWGINMWIDLVGAWPQGKEND
jgi:hypothetical protein